MASGIGVDILANTRDFQRGIQDVEKGLSDVASSLDDIARDGTSSTSKLEDSFSDLADTAKRETKSAGQVVGKNLEAGFKDAQRETEKTERSFKDLADAAKRESKEAGTAISRNVQDGTHKANDSIKSFKDEARQNFGETASSFDGSMSSAVSGIQGTFGGLATTLGPAGAIGAGILGATIGVASTMVTDWSEKQAAIKQGFVDMYREAAEAGRAFLDDAQITAAAAKIIFDDDGRRAQAQADAEEFGLSIQTIARAQAGDQEAINQVLERGGTIRKQITDDVTAGNQVEADQADAKLVVLDTSLDKYRTQLDLQNQQADRAKEFITLSGTTVDEQNRINGVIQARLDAISAAGDKTINVVLNTEQAERNLQTLLSRQRDINVGVRYSNGKIVEGGPVP